MNRRRTRRPIYLTFLVPILLVVLVSSLTVMTVLIRREGARLRAALNDKGETLARYLSFSSEFGVLARDSESLQTLADMVLKVREITRAEIRDGDGVILAQSAKEGDVPEKFLMSIAVPVTTQRTERRKEEIGLEEEVSGVGPDRSGGGEVDFLETEEEPASVPASTGEEIGSVVVRLSTVEVDAAVARARNTVIGMTATSVLILCGVLAMLVRFITSPLKRLVLATNRIAAGNLEETVEIGRRDELGELADSFNLMVGDLKRSMDNLHRTNDFSQAMIPPKDLDGLFRIILDRFRTVPGVGRAALFLVGREEGVMAFAGGDAEFEGLVIPADRVVSGDLPFGDAPLALDDSRGWMQPLREAGGGFVVPLRSKDSLVGAVVAGPQTPVRPEERELAMTFGSIGAMAIENMRLLTIRTENEILRRELAFAHDIQMHLLPHGVPDVGGFEIHPLCIPARELGGDYYDFIPLDGGRKLGITVADVAGKGVPAALFMASSRSYLRAEAEKHATPGMVLASLNRLLHADMKDRTFVSMFYGVFDLREMKLEYANAGHLFPLLLRQGQDDGVYLKAPGLPLGITENASYRTEEVDLQPGDLIIYYTDGLIEAMNPRRELFGFERFEQAMSGLTEREPRAVVTSLMREVETFTEGISLADDLTLIAVKVI